MKRFLVPAACFGFLIQLGFGQTVPARVASPAPTVIPMRPHHMVKQQRIVQPNGNVRAHQGIGATGPLVHQPAPTQPTVRAPVISYADAARRHHRERHDHAWWRNHYATIVFVRGCYYFWDAGYWFPAWGYNSYSDSFDYDGPIYTYGNLLPDQVIFNVQRALQQLGYYSGGLTGSLGPTTRAAIATYQQDAGLTVTGAIDAPTIEALGLY